MSEQKATSAQPLDNQMPTPPAGDEAITTMDNQMPAPPALDLDGDGK
ncbi:hypothetical protein [Streptomyces sp. CRB46]|nr:hypothetical protein [Streptomyces sp. CRB46]